MEINLDALEWNARQVRSLIPAPVQLMAIVKADAYGHGAPMVLSTLKAAVNLAMAGVAAMDEANQILDAGLDLPILVIGVTPDWAIQAAVSRPIHLTVFHDHHVDAIRQVYQRTGYRFPVHIKVDTGMHRIGIPVWDAKAFIEKCQQDPALEVQGLFTHFADGRDPLVCVQQLTRWNALLTSLANPPALLHVANTPGSLACPDSHFDMVRLGMAFYGYDCPEFQARPVMGLKARIVHLQTVQPGEGISYGYSYHVADEPRVIATLPLGYADGIPRGLSNKMAGLYQGQRVPQVGTITMDQLMIDVTDVPNPQVGEVVTLLGQSLTLTDWAKTLNTIEYELLCGLRVRLPKTYARD